MKLGLALMVSTLALTAYVPSGFALSASRGEDLQKFLTTSEGTWEGQGKHQEIQWNGSRVEQDYDLTIRISEQFDKNWQLDSTLREENGLTHYGSFIYGVRDDLLFVGPVTPNEPVNILEASPTSLVYSLQRVDSSTGRVFTYTYDSRLHPGTPDRDGNTSLVLDAHNTIQTNGVVISDDTFSLNQL